MATIQFNNSEALALIEAGKCVLVSIKKNLNSVNDQYTIMFAQRVPNPGYNPLVSTLQGTDYQPYTTLTRFESVAGHVLVAGGFGLPGVGHDEEGNEIGQVDNYAASEDAPAYTAGEFLAKLNHEKHAGQEWNIKAWETTEQPVDAEGKPYGNPLENQKTHKRSAHMGKLIYRMSMLHQGPAMLETLPRDRNAVVGSIKSQPTADTFAFGGASEDEDAKVVYNGKKPRL